MFVHSLRLSGFVALAVLIGAVQPSQADTGIVNEVVLAGDSTVTNSDGWGGALIEFFRDGQTTVANTSVGGKSTKDFNWDVPLGLLADTDDATRPDFLFIQFGHNDQKVYDPSRGTYPVNTVPNVTFTPGDERRYRMNLEDYAAMASDGAHGATPILVTPLARRDHYVQNGQPVFTNDVPKWYDSFGNGYSLYDYAEAARAVGAEHDLPLIDLNALSLDLYASLYEAEGESGLSVLGPDSAHLNGYGAQKIAKLVARELAEIAPGAPSLTSLAEALDPTKLYLPGDLNRDETIDLADWALFEPALGEANVAGLLPTQAYLAGDLDLSGAIVDGDDLAIFSYAYDAVNGVGAFANDTQVPEPTVAAGLVALLVAAGLGRSRGESRGYTA